MQISLNISLIISTYNAEAPLEICLRSALHQTLLPHEIVIADDGSKTPTRTLIERIKQDSPIPIVHVWHEDHGFCRCEIMNKAIIAASGSYIVQADGDILLDKDFIKDHAEAMEEGYFVCGSRVLLDEDTTSKIFTSPEKNVSFLSLPLGYMLNSLRIKPLRKFLSKRYGQKKIDHLRGCNMAFWKKDLLLVNGYNEDLTQWGHEDGEMAFRLHYAGIKKKFIKFGAIEYHLYHPINSKDNEQTHLNAIAEVKAQKLTRCKNGLDKYLSTK